MQAAELKARFARLSPEWQVAVKEAFAGQKAHVAAPMGVAVGNCHEAQTQGRWRERSLDEIQEATERAIRKQGAENASFYSLTWSLHSKIYSLLLWNYTRFGETNLISQRADQASADPNFFVFQNQNGERSATIGVEGISQRMRNYFNKSLHTDQLKQTCVNAAKAGYNSLKWFMILSGMEQKEDTDEFCQLLRDLNNEFKKIAKDRNNTLGKDSSPLRVNPSFMLLLQLPHTAMQWAPCTSSFDLASNSLAPVVDATKECGFGFRTSLTRDRVRISQWSGMNGRESTAILAEAGLRSGFVYFGPIQKRVTWELERTMAKYGYDWMYFFREKEWNTLFPWDGVATPMRRDYLWNQWKVIREYSGVAYCLKTSVNVNPKCSDCGACGTGADRSFMLTRELETAEKLDGQEASRRDMTVRKRVRFSIEIKDIILRTAPKDILARFITRAFMLASSEVEFHNKIVRSFLKVDGTSMKHVEAQGNTPWVMGNILMDHIFNTNWPDAELRKLLPRMNELLAENWPKGKPGMVIKDFVASDKLVYFDAKGYALYAIEMDISRADLQTSLEKFNEKSEFIIKEKVTVGRDIFRMEEVTKIQSEVVPMAYYQPTKTGRTRIVFLCRLTENPVTILTVMTGKRAVHIKPNPIECWGYYKFDREGSEDQAAFQEDDLFAALEGKEIFCRATGAPIETDLFTGELYKSKSAPDLCLAADLKGLVRMRESGIDLQTTTVNR
jgi:galactitol-specific phosphotransferase system IIB component